ncbi:hypothetical protein E4U41_003523 [Claviceps citrina]|nr:hypothetical protein E4U41_003523 [Claviceps citrina]
MTAQELRRVDELERSRLSNVAFWMQGVGEMAMLAVVVGIVRGIGDDNNNNWRLSVLIAFAAAFWLAASLPWFVLERDRPGLAIPPGGKRLTAGLVQLRTTAGQIWRLRQTLVFLAGYFLLADALNTTITVIATLQNQVMEYNTLTLVYLLMANMAAQAAGIALYWRVQQAFGLGVKAMFNAIMLSVLALAAWGMVGNWTGRRFGFHTRWEVWAYQVFYGLFVCPFYSYAQIMISSVTPRGHESLFFSVFNVVGKASSLIGPLISSAIIDATPGGSNDSAPFYFLFALSLVSVAGIWIFLDLDRSAREQDEFLAEEAARVYGVVGAVAS